MQYAQPALPTANVIQHEVWRKHHHGYRPMRHGNEHRAIGGNSRRAEFAYVSRHGDITRAQVPAHALAPHIDNPLVATCSCCNITVCVVNI